MTEIMKFIGDNYNFFKEVAQNITKNKEIGEELLHSVIYYISEKYNKKTLLKAYNNNSLLFLIVYILKNEYNSKTSYYYRENRQIKTNEPEKIYNDNRFDDENYRVIAEKIINDELEIGEQNGDFHWWELTIYKIKNIECKTYREIAKETKIPISSLHNANHKVKNKVEEKIRKKYGNKI